MSLLWMLVVIAAGYATCPANALQCYQCSNLETDAENELIKELFTGKVNPACSHPDPDSVPAVTCAYGFKCYYTEADVSFHYIGFGSVSMQVSYRGCEQTSASSTCHTGNDAVKDVISGTLSLALATDLEVDGKVCYCDDDFCDANCPDDSWLIGDYCMQKWVAVLASGASLVATGLILSCCCCCCCCCCRSSRSQGTVIMTPAVPTVAMSSTTTATSATNNDVYGLQNPGYYGYSGMEQNTTGYTRLKECA